MTNGDRPPEARGSVLLALARASLELALVGAESGESATEGTSEPEWLAMPGASFVTLWLDGELRGCIGSAEAVRPLGEDVRRNALSAACHDPRFAPLTAQELGQVTIELSLLTPPEPLVAKSWAAAVAVLRPGVDGALLESAGRRGLFLPAVWEQLPAAEDFLRRLLLKAGLAEDRWPSDARLWRFASVSWSEGG